MSSKLNSAIATRPRQVAAYPYPLYPPPPDFYLPQRVPSIWLWSGWQDMGLMAGGWIVGMSVALVVLGGMVMGMYYRSQVILPGVQAWGIELGGYTTTEATTLLQQRWQRLPIVLDTGQITITVAPESLGITLDTSVTAQEAYRQSRKLSTWQTFLLTGKSVDIPLDWGINVDMAKNTLQVLVPQLTISPHNAALRVVNGRAEAIPAILGRTLDLTTTLNWLIQNEDSVAVQNRLPLIMMPVQPKISDVKVAVAQANRLLSRVAVVDGYDPLTNEKLTWQITPAMWAAWLSIEMDPRDVTKVTWRLHGEQVKAMMSQQIAISSPLRYVDGEALVKVVIDIISETTTLEELRVYHRDQLYIVEDNETFSTIARKYGIPYPWIEQANPNIDLLSIGQIITIPSRDPLLPLPVVKNKRIIVSMTEQKMRVYENGELKWDWVASTGIDSSPTAPGLFQIQSHQENAYADNWDLWMPYFMGIYRPVPTADFMNGIHGFPSRNSWQILWEKNLGQRITYGCILISTDNARALYEWAEDGVVVEIQP